MPGYGLYLKLDFLGHEKRGHIYTFNHQGPVEDQLQLGYYCWKVQDSLRANFEHYIHGYENNKTDTLSFNNAWIHWAVVRNTNSGLYQIYIRGIKKDKLNVPIPKRDVSFNFKVQFGDDITDGFDGPALTQYTIQFQFYFVKDYNAGVIFKIMLNIQDWIKIQHFNDAYYQITFLKNNEEVKTYPAPDISIMQFKAFAMTYPGNINDQKTLRVFIDNQIYDLKLINNQNLPVIYNKNIESGQNTYLREIRIWSDRMTDQFILQTNQKTLDGYYYSNLIFYDLNEFHQIWPNYPQFFQKGMKIEDKYLDVAAPGNAQPSICLDNQYFNGQACSTYSYLYLRNDLLCDLKIPIKGVKEYQALQIDFWMLLMPQQTWVNVIYIPIGGVAISLTFPELNDLLNLYCFNFVSGQLSTPIPVNTISRIDQNTKTKRLWRKLIIRIFSSSTQFKVSFATDLQVPYEINLFQYGIGDTLYDMSYNQLEAKIVRNDERDQYFNWRQIKQISNVAENILMCDLDEIYDEDRGVCIKQDFLQMRFLKLAAPNHTTLLNNPVNDYRATDSHSDYDEILEDRMISENTWIFVSISNRLKDQSFIQAIYAQFQTPQTQNQRTGLLKLTNCPINIGQRGDQNNKTMSSHLFQIKEFSFSLMMHFNIDDGGQDDLLNIDNFIDIFCDNKTFYITLYYRVQSKPSEQIMINLTGQSDIKWGLHYDVDNNLFKITVGTVLHYSVSMTIDEFPLPEKWEILYGYNNRNQSGKIMIISQMFFSPSIRYMPTRSYQGAQILKYLDKTAAYEAQFGQAPIDIMTGIKDYTYQSVANNPQLIAQNYNCREGTIKHPLNKNCIIPYSLTINNQQLQLNVLALQIGHSTTVQFWSYLFKMGDEQKNITLLEVENLSGIGFQDRNLIFYHFQQTPNLLRKEEKFPISPDISSGWFKYHMVLYNNTWNIYTNGDLIMSVPDLIGNYENIEFSSININVTSDQNYKMKISEIAIFGYPLSQSAIIKNLNSKISKDIYLNTLLVYYQLDESYGYKLYDYSKYERSTILSNLNRIYWDYNPKGVQGSNLMSQHSEIQTRDKALFFKYQVDNQTQFNFAKNNVKIGQDLSLSFCYRFLNVSELLLKRGVIMFNIIDVMDIQLDINTISEIQFNIYPLHSQLVGTEFPLIQIDSTIHQWKCLVGKNRTKLIFFELDNYQQQLTLSNMIKLSRQVVNPLLYWGQYLTMYYQMDESIGNKLLESKSGVYYEFNMAEGNKLKPQWVSQDPQLIVCEGPLNAFLVEYQEMFKIRLMKEKKLNYKIGDSSSVQLDISKAIKDAKWILLFQMANTDSNYSCISVVYNIETSSQIQNISKIITKQFKFSENLLARNISIQTGNSSRIFIRDFQFWNAPLSLGYYLTYRMHRGLDPIVMASKGLIIYYKFDESGGNTVINSAQPFKPIDTFTASFLQNDDFKWYYYSSLQMNNETDSIDKRYFMFCKDPYSRILNKHCDYYDHCNKSLSKLDDCISQDPNSTAKCNNSLNYIYSMEYQDCQDCYFACQLCNQSYSRQILQIKNLYRYECVNCKPSYNLRDGLCTQECDQYQYYINGTCQEDNLTACAQCKNSSHIYLENQQKCLDISPDFKYFDFSTSTLDKCHPYCKSCFGQNQYTCFECAENITLISKYFCNSVNCMAAGEIIKVNSDLKNSNSTGECVPCLSPCVTCVNKPDYCTSCGDDYLLIDGACLTCSSLNGFNYPIIGSGTKGQRCTEICGDGLRFNQNQCDDGNLNDGDGCSSQCRVESNYKCLGGSTTSKDICQDTLGPTVQILSIGSESRFIILEFSDNYGQVFTDAKKFGEQDFYFHFEGIDVDVPSYSVKGEIHDDFKKNKRIFLNFSPKFSIPDEGATLSIGFKNSSLFYDQYFNPISILQTNKFKLQKFEYKDPRYFKAITDAASSVSHGTQVLLAINLILSVSLDKALDSLYSAINSVQILFYLPLIDIPFPNEVYQIFKYLSYANFENQLIKDPISSVINFDNISDSPINQVFNNYGYESQVFLKSYQYKLGMIFAIYCFYPLSQLFKNFKSKNFQIFKAMDNFFLWNGSLRLGYELYLEMGIYAYLNLYNIQYDNLDQIVSSIIAIIAMAFVTFFPLITMNLVQQNGSANKSTKNRFNTLMENFREIRITQYVNGQRQLIHKSLLPQLHFSAFLFRRLLYIWILVLLTGYPALQIMLCILKTIGMLSYLIYVQPFKNKINNAMNIFNETLTGIAFSVCFIFERGMNESKRKYYGWVIIGLASTILVANLVVGIFETMKNLKVILGCLILRVKQTLNRKTRNENKNIKSSLQNIKKRKSMKNNNFNVKSISNKSAAMQLSHGMNDPNNTLLSISQGTSQFNHTDQSTINQINDLNQSIDSFLSPQRNLATIEFDRFQQRANTFSSSQQKRDSFIKLRNAFKKNQQHQNSVIFKEDEIIQQDRNDSFRNSQELTVPQSPNILDYAGNRQDQ
ncbi:UNKNOWN [Stylonychia lemnae]|uniref:Uncharacterized protein n=1 Tax=Stylonychia lemnae TaxID=5949 RepID=A0A078A0Z9_STYLE|nr:UNKNOWN [Stylonychia lemnae]|eukprot:CDW75881.1 UNKNOWN [Stylonychia lemnae]